MIAHLISGAGATDKRHLPRGLIWTILVLSFLPLILSSVGVDFSAGRDGEAGAEDLEGRVVHNLMEWTAVCVAAFTTILSFLYIRQKPDNLVVIIAITMGFVTALDVFHTLGANHLLESAADNRIFIPITWAVSRFSNALLLTLGGILLLSRRSPLLPKSAFTIAAAGIGLFGLIYWGVHFFAMNELIHRTYFPGSFVTRPWDLPALLLFIASGVFIYPIVSRDNPGLFGQTLLVGIVPHTVCQLHMSFGSTEIFDGHFNIAHFLKITAYFVPLSALSLHFIRSYRRELTATERLEETVGGLRQEADKRTQMEKRLRSQEMRLTQLTDNIREVFWIGTPLVREWVYVSPAYEEIFGRSCESLYRDPHSLLEAIHPEDREQVRALMEQEVHGDFGVDFRIVRPDGQLRWIRTRAFPVRNENGEIYRVAGIAEDTTEQKEAELALKKTEARNQALISALPDMIFRINKDGVYLDYQIKDHSALAASPEDFLGKRVWDIFPELEERVRQALERTLETGAVQIIEYPFRLRGELRDYEGRFVASGDDEALIIVRDITEHKRLEREILEISSREQQRIGHDLHDGLSQQLAGIALLGKVLHKRLSAKSLPETDDARRIVDHVKEAITQTRHLARGLSPVQLVGQGLHEALEELALWVENLHSVECRLYWENEIRIDDLATATHLYRIAQEAVGNALRHAEPTRIDIELADRKDFFSLTIRDNGCGLPDGAGSGNGMGFNIMQYRARMIDASLDITTGPEGGTFVTCKFHNKQGH
jgi:PAS domain S-box-containing protein